MVREKLPEGSPREGRGVEDRVKLNRRGRHRPQGAVALHEEHGSPRKASGEREPGAVLACLRGRGGCVVSKWTKDTRSPGVTSNESMDTACDPVFWMVTRRELLESAALLIPRVPWVVELVGRRRRGGGRGRLILSGARMLGPRHEEHVPEDRRADEHDRDDGHDGRCGHPSSGPFGLARPTRDLRRVAQASITRARSS